MKTSYTKQEILFTCGAAIAVCLFFFECQHNFLADFVAWVIK